MEEFESLTFFKSIEFKYHFIYYALSVFILTFIIRFILNLFKAWAIKNGEIDELWENPESKWSNKKRGYILIKSFCSLSGDIRINDYWLPFFIGIFELSVFPFLMAENLWKFIGAWIGIKIASSWTGWQKTRTAYNRFLLGNILSLGTSYFLAWIFFKS